MADIVAYVRECADGFAERPLCRVDSLVLSCLSYLWIPEELPDAASAAGVRLGTLGSPSTALSLTAPVGNQRAHERLLVAVAESPRFSGVRAALATERSDAQDERQFAAVTFLLPSGEAYVAFRGTDNSLLGWKEDLNMAFSSEVPAQRDARDYLGMVARALDGPLYVGGHSKGGNLATYATLSADDATRSRVLRYFDHDGPGFSDELLAQAHLADAGALVEKTVPGESLVGLLMNGVGAEPVVVRSVRAGVMQHDPFSWVVEGNDFALRGALSYDAYRTARRANAWLAQMAPSDRERLVSILYRLAQATGEVSFSGLVQSLKDGSLALVLQRLDGMSAPDRDFFLASLAELAATLVLGPAPSASATPAEKASAAADMVDDLTARFNVTMAKWEKYLG